MTRFRRAAAAAACPAALAAMLAATIPPATAAPPARFRGTVTMCNRDAARVVANSSGASYVVRNDWWGAGDDQCIANRNHWSNFTVTRSHPAGHVGVAGYPYILYGCSWGACSPGAALPLRVADSGRLAASWWTSGTRHAPGQWNAAFDIWIMRSPHTSGQAHGAEVMIWLDTRGYRTPAGRMAVTIGGAQWWRSDHLACTDKARLTGCWRFVLYWRVRPVSHVSRLPVGSFLADAARAGFARPGWYVTGIEAGFEIWAGGTGLGTSWFWAGQRPA
jgi:cellulose 1,4-beta-cellobiosidase